MVAGTYPVPPHPLIRRCAPPSPLGEKGFYGLTFSTHNFPGHPSVGYTAI